MEAQQSEKRVRGQGRGSSFFALGHDVWQRLWTVETTNRLNLIITYLVLLAGTGSDHRLTKWSAKACEEHTGLGKPRAKHAIEELISAGLSKRTPSSTRMTPQYELLPLPPEADPIFLPVALVTGLVGEASMLRRVRETGDVLMLRMLIDLYGLISLDGTHGIPLQALYNGKAGPNQSPARKIADVGAHAVWAVSRGSWRGAAGDWAQFHRIQASENDVAWRPFWDRLDLLKQVGAIWYEPWLFDGEELDAEPLFPLDPAGFYPVAAPSDEARLTSLAYDVARSLVGDERAYVFDNAAADFYVPLTLHRKQPAYREVARLRVEADTPGRRLSWRRRRTLIEQHLQGYQQMLDDATNSNFNRPMQLGRDLGGLL